jgi:hypothetical protein
MVYVLMKRHYNIKPLEYSGGKLFRNGRRCGSLDQRSGYRNISIRSKTQLEHRVIWEMHHGEIPDGYQVDHINRVRDDNRIENLRLVTPGQNRLNNGGRGWHKKPCGTYQVQICDRYVGCFETQEEAEAAYEREKLKVWETY